jgi:hypothetical protein
VNTSCSHFHRPNETQVEIRLHMHLVPEHRLTEPLRPRPVP